MSLSLAHEFIEYVYYLYLMKFNLEINIAETEMPGLMSIRKEYKNITTYHKLVVIKRCIRVGLYLETHMNKTCNKCISHVTSRPSIYEPSSDY